MSYGRFICRRSRSRCSRRLGPPPPPVPPPLPPGDHLLLSRPPPPNRLRSSRPPLSSRRGGPYVRFCAGFRAGGSRYLVFSSLIFASKAAFIFTPWFSPPYASILAAMASFPATARAIFPRNHLGDVCIGANWKITPCFGGLAPVVIVLNRPVSAL